MRHDHISRYSLFAPSMAIEKAILRIISQGLVSRVIIGRDLSCLAASGNNYPSFFLFSHCRPIVLVTMDNIDLDDPMSKSLQSRIRWHDADEHLLLGKPHNPRKDRLVNWQLILQSYVFIGVIETLSSFAMSYWYL